LTAKNIKAKTRASAPQPSAPAGPGIKMWHADVIACAALFLAVFLMFYQIPLENKVFSKGDDTESGKSFYTYAREEANVRDYPLWCPYVFGGFPGLAAGAYSNYWHMEMPYALASKYLSPRNWADEFTIRGLLLGPKVDDVHDDARWYVAMMLYVGLLTYLLMRRIGFRPLIASISGLVMAWNPYLVSLATAAHGGKMETFIYTPLIVLLAWNVMDKRRILDMALLALGFGWQIAVGGHTQVMFYSFVTVGIMYLVWAFFELKEKASILVLKPAGMIAVALLLGFAVGALWYIPLLKYLPYSIRGMGPAIAKAGAAATGYTMADATMWSMSPKELITFVVPSWFGLKSPYYWGDMPFTSSSFYFGVVPFLFAVFAFFGKKDRLFWGLVFVSIFSILLSFGSSFSWFYGLFFNYFPFFNKFRTPSLILLLVILAGLVFSGYGLRFVLGLKDNIKWRKAFLYGAAVCGVLLVIFVLSGDALSGLFGSFSKAGESQQYNSQQLSQLATIRYGMLRNDLVLACLWVGLAFGACWLLITGKIKATAFLAIILVITVVDLYRFSHQFFEPKPASTMEEVLKTNAVVDKLRQDSSIFRVMPVGRLIQDNRWAAWEIPSLGGYHGAKMRSYQDLLDNVFFSGADRRVPLNLPFFSAMNCKYLVVEGQLPPTLGLEPVAQDDQAKMYLYKNPRALERAYFADSIVVNNDRAETMRKIMDPSFPWDYAAIVDKSLPGPVVRDYNRKATIDQYLPESVRISATLNSPGFLVLSDAYYAPGWTAFDNGTSTEIYQVNSFVRGVYLRPGTHSVEFRYTGKYEKEGVTVATLSHFLVWGLVIGAFYWERRRRKAVQA
jgi:hypothetical protein